MSFSARADRNSFLNLFYHQWPLLGLLVFLFFLGLHHHLLFRIEIGEWGYFKNAYDEETYMIWYDQWRVGHFRWLSMTVYHFLEVLFSKEYVALVADSFFPVIFGFLSYSLAARVSKNFCFSVFFALILLLAPDLFSMQNSVVFGDWSIQNLLKHFDFLYGWVPEASTTYFEFLRNFEPMLSWLYYLFIFFMIFDSRSLENREFFSGNSKYKLIARVMLVFSATTYSFLYLSFVVFLIVWILFCLLSRFKSEFRSTVFVLLTCLASLIFFRYFDRSSANVQMTYVSRAPFFSISIVISLVLAFFVYKNSSLSPFLKRLSYAFLAVPLIVLNQQIVTGILVSVRDWEKYVCYFYPSFSLLILSSMMPRISQERQRLLSLFFLVFIVLVCPLLIYFSSQSYSRWKSYNHSAIKYARVVQNLLNKYNEPLIILDNPKMSAHLRWKYNLSSQYFIIDYTELFEKRIGSFIQGQEIENKNYFKRKLFNFFKLNNRSPEEVRKILIDQFERGTGFELHFLYSLHDVWYPITDRRLEKKTDILTDIGFLVSEYRTHNIDLSKDNNPIVFVRKDNFKLVQ